MGAAQSSPMSQVSLRLSASSFPSLPVHTIVGGQLVSNVSPVSRREEQTVLYDHRRGRQPRW